MTGRTIVITSGKGGVGKTTATANIGSALAMRGKKVVVIDTDIGLRNLDVIMGLENRIVYDLVNVLEGKCKLRQAMIKDKHGYELYLIPAAQTRDKGLHRPRPVARLVRQAGSRVRLRPDGLPCRNRARVQERGRGGPRGHTGHDPGSLGHPRCRPGHRTPGSLRDSPSPPHHKPDSSRPGEAGQHDGQGRHRGATGGRYPRAGARRRKDHHSRQPGRASSP